MMLPNYKDGSILNLIGSIARAVGTKTNYEPLRLLQPEEILRYKNIILIVLDGLGYDYLKRYGEKRFLMSGLRGRITSVFPSTTASAIPSLHTGCSCIEHGMTGWFTYIKELGMVVTSLPYNSRVRCCYNLNERKNIKEIFNIKPFTDRTGRKKFIVTPKDLSNTVFTKIAAGKARIIPYNKVNEGFNKITKIVKKSRKKYFYAYYPEHDHLCHLHYTHSKKVLKNFLRLDRVIERFVKSSEGTESIVIVTSDHGSDDTDKHVVLNDYPEVYDTLRLPLSGDHKCAYCYLKNGKEREFLRAMKKIKNSCYLFKSEELVKRGVFGIEKPDKRFLDRIGDYIIVAKEGYGIYDFIGKTHKKRKFNKGDHGGLSEREMTVPLIVFK